MAGSGNRLRRRARAWVLAGLAIGASSGASAQSAAATSVPPPQGQPAQPQPPGLAAMTADIGNAERVLPLEVVVNGAKQGPWLLLERAGALYAPIDAVDEWRLQARPDTGTVVYKGSTYIPLASIPGFSAKVDFSTQSVDLNFSPQAF